MGRWRRSFVVVILGLLLSGVPSPIAAVGPDVSINFSIFTDGPPAVAFLPDGSRALVTDQLRHRVLEISLSDMSISRTFQVAYPLKIVTTADGQFAYVLSRSVVDYESRKITKLRLSDGITLWATSSQGGSGRCFGWAQDIALSADELRLFATDYSGRVCVAGEIAQFSTDTGARLPLIEASLPNRYEKSSSLLATSVFPDGRFVSARVMNASLAVFDSSTVRIWDIPNTAENATAIRTAGDGVHVVVVSPTELCSVNITASTKRCVAVSTNNNPALHAAADGMSGVFLQYQAGARDYSVWRYQLSGDDISISEVYSSGLGANSAAMLPNGSGALIVRQYWRVATYIRTPHAPLSLQVSNGDAASSIAFSPGSDMGAIVTNYEYSLNGGAWQARSPASTAPIISLSGLTNDQVAEVRLRAVSNWGAGDSSTVAVLRPTAVPGKPTDLSAIRGSLSAEISFTPGLNGALGPVWNYQYKVDSGAWTDLSPMDAVSPIAVPLPDNDNAHAVRIRARNNSGPGVESDPVAMPAISGVTPPTSVAAVRSNGGMDISFTPGSNGNQILTTFQYSLNNGSSWETPTGLVTQSPIRLTGLSNADTFTVRVRGVGGALGPGTASDAVVAPSVNLPADPVVSLAGLEQETATIQLQFANDGGSPLIRTTVNVYTPDSQNLGLWEYLKTVSRDFGGSDTLTVIMQITGLSSGTRYLFVGTGTNRIGTNDDDNQWDPAPDREVQAKTLETLSLTGAYPMSPISTYQRGGETLTITGTDFYAGQTVVSFGTETCLHVSVESSTQLTCVTPQFPVIAGIDTRTVTISRWGESVAITNPVQLLNVFPPGPPGPPNVVTTSSTSNSISIVFSPGGDDGGGAITNYAYELIPDGGSSGGLVQFSPVRISSPVTISALNETGTALSPGTRYRIFFRAIGVGGVLGTSTGYFFETTTARLVAPSGFTATPGANSIQMAWSNPVAASFDHVEYSITGGETWTSAAAASSVTVTGLQNGKKYRVVVRGVDSSGLAGEMSPFLEVTPVARPAQPLGLWIFQRGSILDLDVTTASDNGSPISHYQYSLNNGSSWQEVAASGIRSYSIAGTRHTVISVANVPVGSSQMVRVRAKNSEGVSDSISLQYQVLDVPYAPTVSVETVTATTISVRVKTKVDSVHPLYGYEARLLDAQGFQIASNSFGGQGLPVSGEHVWTRTFTGLQSGKTYTFTYLARNQVGPTSELRTSILTDSAPPAPRIQTITAGSKSVQVKFSQQTAGSSAIQKYQFSTDDGLTWNDRTDAGGLTETMTITGLSNKLRYKIRLRATNVGALTSSPSAAVEGAPRPDCTATPAVEVDYSSCTLNGKSWASVDLTSAVFESATLATVNLANAILRQADLRGATIAGGTLAGADLYAANVDGANLANAVISNGAGPVVGTPAVLPATMSLVDGIFLSRVAELSGLSISAANSVPLDQTFSASRKSYTASVSASVTEVTVVPSVTDQYGVIRVGSSYVPSDVASEPIPLSTGPNIIDVVVTARDGSTTDTYTVTLSRATVGGAGGGGGGAGGGGGGAAPVAAGPAASDTKTASVTDTATATPKLETSTVGGATSVPAVTGTAPVTDTATATKPIVPTTVTRFVYTYSPRQAFLTKSQLNQLRAQLTSKTVALTVLGYVTRSKSTSADRLKSLQRANRAALQIARSVQAPKATTRGAGGAAAKGCARTKNNCVVVILTRTK